MYVVINFKNASKYTLVLIFIYLLFLKRYYAFHSGSASVLDTVAQLGRGRSKDCIFIFCSSIRLPSS